MANGVCFPMERKQDYIVSVGNRGTPHFIRLQKIRIESGLPLLVESKVKKKFSISTESDSKAPKKEREFFWKITGSSDVDALKTGIRYAEILFQAETFLSGLGLLEKELKARKTKFYNAWRARGFIHNSKYTIGKIESRFDTLTQDLSKEAPSEVSNIVKELNQKIKDTAVELEKKKGDIEVQDTSFSYFMRVVFLVVGFFIGQLLTIFVELLRQYLS